MIFGGKACYKGMAMRTAHCQLDIQSPHFAEMLNCYRQAMQVHEVEEMDIEVLLAKLAFTKREVLNE